MYFLNLIQETQQINNDAFKDNNNKEHLLNVIKNTKLYNNN